MRERDNGGIIGPLNLASAGPTSGVWTLIAQEINQLGGTWPGLTPLDFEYLIVAAGGTTLTFGITGTILSYTGTITYTPQYSLGFNVPISITVGTISIIAYPSIYAPIRLFTGSLAYTYTVNTQRPGYRVYQFTSGTGTITF